MVRNSPSDSRGTSTAACRICFVSEFRCGIPEGAASATLIVPAAFLTTNDVPVNVTALYQGIKLTRPTIVRYYPVATATPTVTNTPVDTATNTPVDTATNTPEDMATATATDTATDVPTDTATPTATATATAAATATETAALQAHDPRRTHRHGNGDGHCDRH